MSQRFESLFSFGAARRNFRQKQTISYCDIIEQAGRIAARWCRRHPSARAAQSESAAHSPASSVVHWLDMDEISSIAAEWSGLLTPALQGVDQTRCRIKSPKRHAHSTHGVFPGLCGLYLYARRRCNQDYEAVMCRGAKNPFCAIMVHISPNSCPAARSRCQHNRERMKWA